MFDASTYYMNVQIYVTGNKEIFCINILYISRIIKCILGQKKIGHSPSILRSVNEIVSTKYLEESKQ